LIGRETKAEEKSLTPSPKENKRGDIGRLANHATRRREEKKGKSSMGHAL